MATSSWPFSDWSFSDSIALSAAALFTLENDLVTPRSRPRSSHRHRSLPDRISTPHREERKKATVLTDPRLCREARSRGGVCDTGIPMLSVLYSLPAVTAAAAN